MKITAYALWNAFFTLFFLCLVVVGLDYLYRIDRLTLTISLGDFLLIALAIFRLIRLVAYDLIFASLRAWLASYPKGTFLGTVSELVHCPWCIGLWFSFVTLFAYFATPFAWPVILILALASVASIFQILANLIGWNAEYKKHQTNALTASTQSVHIQTDKSCG